MQNEAVTPLQLIELWETTPDLAQVLIEGHHVLHHYYEAFSRLPLWTQPTLIDLLQTMGQAQYLPPALMGLPTANLTQLTLHMETAGQSLTLQCAKAALGFCHTHGAAH